MNEGNERRALWRAVALLALIALARIAPWPLSRAIALAAATLQLYWPLLAYEQEGLRATCMRFYVRGARSELFVAAVVLLVTLPPWGWLSAQMVPLAPPSFALPTFHWSLMGAGLEMVLLAGQEEWFWRGYVQAAWHHSIGAIVLSSALFGACHWAFTGSPLGLATALPSLVFGLLAKRQRRLLACTLVHIGYNVASRLLFFAG